MRRKLKEEYKCNKHGYDVFDDGSCCCNCAYHYEDFHHCTTKKKEEGEGCVCSQHKGWICIPPYDGEERRRAHSGWKEHGLCEMHYPAKEKSTDS